MPGYGQFCPIAQASEVITERWTPLVLCELARSGAVASTTSSAGCR
jgi:DNA-binding HxlR family transcriptional regulator